MKNKVSFKIGLTVLLTTLIVVSSINSITFGQQVIKINEKQTDKDYFYGKFNKYNASEINPEEYKPGELPISECSPISNNNLNIKMVESQQTVKILDGPVDSPWPMYCHDIRHTGRSPYSTADNPGIEQWRFDTIEETTGSPVIDDNGDIYIGACHLFSVYPNGTLKWKYNEPIKITSAPAIDENGILYVGSIWAQPNYLYAIYTNNGTVKWKFKVGQDIWSSPAIGKDGSIYFGSENDYIYALNPNGTLKWKYLTNVAVFSSPAIGPDGTVYCGSHDTYLYAFNPNNGTVKWNFKTGHWIRTSPCIGDDGTIYAVSLDDNLYALYPNGTLKWKKNIGEGGTSPTIGQDGTIYCGYTKLRAVNPDNGSIKWTFNPGKKRTIQEGTPCTSADGTIYFGTHIGETDGGELIAVNPDGTERWRIMLASDWIMSAPAIGEDGTVYVGSYNNKYQSGAWGYLHAVGSCDPDAPSAPLITGPTGGTIGKEYEYKFKSTSPLGRDVYYYIEWGDGDIMDFSGPFGSGEEVIFKRTYSDIGNYTIRANARDTENLPGPWGYLKVTMPRNKAMSNSLFYNFLERFPLLTKLLLLLR